MAFVDANDEVFKNVGSCAEADLSLRIRDEIQRKYHNIPIHSELLFDSAYSEETRKKRLQLRKRNEEAIRITEAYRAFYEPRTEEILKDMGGINMNGLGFVLPDDINKVVIRMKDGREYEGGVARVEYMPGNLGRAGFSELTVTTMKQTKEKSYGIQRAIFNNPATIVYWEDGTKTVVYCNDNMKDGKPQKADTFSAEVGLAMAIVKKQYGNVGGYNGVFRKFVPGMKEQEKAAKKAALKAKKAAKKAAMEAAAMEATESVERSEECVSEKENED